MAVTDDARRALRGALALIDASRLGATISREARVDAERAAERLLTAGAGAFSVLATVAGLLATVAGELAANRDEAQRLVMRLQAEHGLPAVALGREVLRGEPVAHLPADAIRALVFVFTDAATGDREAARSLLSASAPVLDAHRQPDAMVAVERRLARLRFDLHDGPQQDIHLLAQDLRLFRDQLRPMIVGDADEARALGRLDDLEAQLLALDEDLRRLLTTVQSPFLTPAALPDGLRLLTDAFAQRTGVVPETRLSGSVTSLTDSQQIALLSLIREALSNIRRHSDAHRVQITIEAGSQGVEVEVSDDGSGFDPEATQARAAGAGRLGLVGMHERVRMLGGSTEIHSRPGGPTVISANLPAWSADD